MTNSSIDTIKPGDQIKATITARHYFGIMVDIPISGFEGFIHELDFPSGEKGRTNTLTVGKTIETWVLDINPTTHRIALSLINPRRVRRLALLRPGEKIEGVVSKITDDIGAFIDVGAERDGLIHVTEIERARWQGVLLPRIDEKVVVYVYWVDIKQDEKSRLSLGLLPQPRKKISDLNTYTRYKGRVMRIQPFGAFVDIDAETEGLLHVSEMADGYVPDPRAFVKEYDLITVRITSLDESSGKFKLTMKI
jgi:small subunit ribosomal protein S1